MSYVQEPGICYCSCHSRMMQGNMRHCVPCCRKCPTCGKNVRPYGDHMEKCKEDFERRVAEAEQHNG